MRLGAALVLWMALSVGAWALDPEERLDDPALEERAREISKEVRCLVCQNESIDASNAELAKDLRLLVRERLSEGDSDEEVRAYLVDRYGDYVLLRPPVRPSTWALWAGPFLVLLIAGATLVLMRRRDRPEAVAALSEDERARLDSLTAKSGRSDES
ncbi:MAG: cytochrome c-type biogenesis protein [Pseudomonadota bacterium]